MGPYNTDPVLHTELAKIDRAREETIHKMMADYGLRHPDDFD